MPIEYSRSLYKTILGPFGGVPSSLVFIVVSQATDAIIVWAVAVTTTGGAPLVLVDNSSNAANFVGGHCH